MDFEFELLIPIAFFFFTFYTIKVIVEARTRAKLIAANVSQELLQSMIKAEELQRRYSSLRWGSVLCCLAIGFALIQALHLPDATPIAIALILGATGVGNLVFYMLTKNDTAPRAAS